MRNALMYPRLAAQSLRKNGRFYLPYLLTCIFTAAMFYILLYLGHNEGLHNMRGTIVVESMMFIGAIVVALFSTVVLLYANGFLMKRRQKELGLYNILGMNKRNIGCIMLWETIYSLLIMIVVGLAVGILLSKLILLMLCAILKYDAQFGFGISDYGVSGTAIMSGVILLLSLLNNLWRVGKSKPIELLRSGNIAEREPQTKWLIAIIGVIALGAGYLIANQAMSPITALEKFFPAVILVMVGTYCLFSAGSIAVLKALRRKKNYYYKTQHFITVSGMLHRMNRNAIGLGSICILCTMVLVTVSATLSLYLGSENSLSKRYPREVILTYADGDENAQKRMMTAIEQETSKLGASVEDLTVSHSMEFSAVSRDGVVTRRESGYSAGDLESVIIYAIPLSEYMRDTGKTVQLAHGEVLMQTLMGVHQIGDTLTVLGSEYKLKKIDDFPVQGYISAFVAQMYLLVVPDEEMTALRARYAEQPTNSAYYPFEGQIDLTVGFNTDVEGEEQIALMTAVFDSVNALAGDEAYNTRIDSNNDTVRSARISIECRADGEYEFNAMYGGFFFIGIFLGLLFLAATVLIIYYKQVSEGYEDAGRFKIMQQVGMDESVVRKSVKSQVLTVFFLPLVMAGVHIVAAFYLIQQILAIFSLFNSQLFMLCGLGTFLLFAAVYALIFTVTAKSYYKIVRM